MSILQDNGSNKEHKAPTANGNGLKTCPNATEKPDKISSIQVELARRIVEDFDQLSKEIGDGQNFFNGAEMIDTFDLRDKLFSIKYRLITETDGRPSPLDFLEKGEWAQCGDTGYDSVAYIDHTECNKEQLIELRDWINSVLDWHEKRPERIKY